MEAADGISGGAVLTADGGVYELCLNRRALGLDGNSVRVRPGFTASGVNDSINGTTIDVSTWLTVNLEAKTAVADSTAEAVSAQ